MIYDLREGMESLVGEYGMEKKFHIEKVLGVEECLEKLSVLDEMDTVFLSGIHSHERNIILKYCMYQDIQVYVIPRIGDVIMGGAKKVHMFAEDFASAVRGGNLCGLRRLLCSHVIGIFYS